VRDAHRCVQDHVLNSWAWTNAETGREEANKKDPNARRGGLYGTMTERQMARQSIASGSRYGLIPTAALRPRTFYTET